MFSVCLTSHMTSSRENDRAMKTKRALDKREKKEMALGLKEKQQKQSLLLFSLYLWPQKSRFVLH